MNRAFFLLVVFVVGLSCEEEKLSPPEISFDLQPVYAWTRISNEDPYIIDIQIFNDGEQPLVIEQPIEIRGDTRCSFTFHEPTKTRLGPSQSAFVRGYYKPENKGEDHIQLTFKSNSKTFPEFEFLICGEGVGENDPEPAANLECKKPEPSQADCAEEQWIEQ